MKSWSISDSVKLYHVENWGDQYFSINPRGNLTVHPKGGSPIGVDMLNIVKEISQRNVGLPVLIRFQDILRDRVIRLNETFQEVMKKNKYKGKYKGVYPIKVNQMREVVEEIIDAGEPFDYGLEAGSKAELAAIIGLPTNPKALIICNGYKDYGFLKTALLGTKLGKNIIIVVEKMSEIDQIIQISKELNVTPRIGIRCKLSSKGSGRWESSAGDDAKFGLTTPQMIQAIETLKKHGLESSFELLHFHVGSQVNDIRTLKEACREAARFYCKLKKMNLPLQYIDVGGGLGVDYHGCRSSMQSSINYSLEEYVQAVVTSIKEVCKEEKVNEPDVVSESGRAIVAHHSVLIVNCFGSIEMDSEAEFPKSDSESELVSEMKEILKNVDSDTLLESYHNALSKKDQANNMFKLGLLELVDKAKVEDLFWKISRQVYDLSQDFEFLPEELNKLHRKMADQYLCNFSLFQSMVDHWAINHLFPIVPIHRHDEEPVRQATLADITCDSDGKIKDFIDLYQVRHTLPVHKLEQDEPYYLGIFLMGAYQDIMGDLHNLFGRVNEVHVFVDESEPNGYYIEEVIRGNNVASVLSLIQYSASDLAKGVKQKIDLKVKEGVVKPREGVDLLTFYENVLTGYTYMNHGNSENQYNRHDPAGLNGNLHGVDELESSYV